MGDRVTLAQKLVDSYRTKAIELLVDYLQNKDIRTDAEQYIGNTTLPQQGSIRHLSSTMGPCRHVHIIATSLNHQERPARTFRMPGTA